VGLQRLPMVLLCVAEGESLSQAQATLTRQSLWKRVWLTWHVGHLKQLCNQPLPGERGVAVDEQPHNLRTARPKLDRWFFARLLSVTQCSLAVYIARAA